jgi:hypothetical protein
VPKKKTTQNTQKRKDAKKNMGLDFMPYIVTKCLIYYHASKLWRTYMMKIATLLLLTLVTALQAEIIETAHFQQIRDHVTPDTLVVVDIDDTLLITKQMLGCDEWFMMRLAEHEQLSPKNVALERCLAEYFAIRHLSKMEIVEPGTEAILGALQKEGYKVMGLTTQGLALATRTCIQLNEVGINLLASAPHPHDECVSVRGHTVLYRQGILFTSGTAKGEALFGLCDKIGYKPARILFINDKASHLRDIEVAAEARGVPFIGLRYAFSDEKKKAFDPEIARYQFTHSTFDSMVSDEEAKQNLNLDSAVEDAKSTQSLEP